ncbi:hypothetical protein KAR91_85670 [Candidatus Pacearchaeota archaeon]|nr:hypothetical protein [Candidatus Pacearchaeota archaeon]
MKRNFWSGVIERERCLMLLSEFLEFLSHFDGDAVLLFQERLDDGVVADTEVSEVAETMDSGYVTIYLQNK